VKPGFPLSLVVAVQLCVLPGQVALSAESPGPSQGDGSFFESYYFPPTDRNLGALYRQAAGLLQVLKDLPEALDRRRIVARRFGGVGAGEEAAEKEDVPPVQEPAEDEVKWRQVVDQAVIAGRALAYEYFRRGQYEKAITIYRGLREDDPRDAHLLGMLALCERNLGRSAEGYALMEEAAHEDPKFEKWTQLLQELDSLVEPLEEAGQ